MPVVFNTIKVIPRLDASPEGGFSIYWTISGQDFSPTFQVWVGETESGPWTALLSTKTSDMFVVNVASQKINLQPALTWFKVGVYNGSTLVKESWPADSRNAMSRREYLRYREILRRWRLVFEKTPCNPGWLVRRKFYGAKCTICTDEVIDTPVSSECTSCYGTGITGGYYTPYAMKAEWFKGGVPRVSNVTKKESPGPLQVQKAAIKIFAVPDAKSEDLWIDHGTRIIYLVEAVDPEQWNGSVITQTLALSRLPAHHPAYKLQLPV